MGKEGGVGGYFVWDRQVGGETHKEKTEDSIKQRCKHTTLVDIQKVR